MPQRIRNIPSAARLTMSLRDIGYGLAEAVADIVDNSVDASATSVDVHFHFAGSESWIRIADDGTGIPTDKLNEALRYGTERDYGEQDHGKFGLGLKTASLSQCRQLTVATRVSLDRRGIEIRRWDLDDIGDWDMLRLSTRECPDELLDPLQDRPGTVVMWTKLDRVLAYKLPEGQAALHGFDALSREVEDHLAMVFHRFLTGGAKHVVPLALSVNHAMVHAWDPFATSEPATQKLPRQSLPLHHEGRTHQLAVQPYILPRQDQFSTLRAFNTASGPKQWNRQQGFYIYRGDRMIQSGGWNRLRAPDEHSKLARIALDIPRAADTAFELNVSKMRVVLPGEVRPPLKAVASGVVARAQGVYRQKPALPRTPRLAPSPFAGPDSRATGAPWEPEVDGGPLTVPWRLIETVLEREFVAEPDRLERVLEELRGRHFRRSARVADAP